MNEKPITPGEFIAICQHVTGSIDTFVMDRAYASIGTWSPQPSTPSEAVNLVKIALMNAGVSVTI